MGKRPEQVKAHRAVHKALREGRLRRPPACENCGRVTERIDAHHEDYSKPLDVDWLCVWCHRTGPPTNYKGRGPQKLNWSIVREIRARYQKGEPPYQYELAEEYNVSQALISAIVSEKIWREEDDARDGVSGS